MECLCVQMGQWQNLYSHCDYCHAAVINAKEEGLSRGLNPRNSLITLRESRQIIDRGGKYRIQLFSHLPTLARSDTRVAFNMGWSILVHRPRTKDYPIQATTTTSIHQPESIISLGKRGRCCRKIRNSRIKNPSEIFFWTI